MATRWRRFVWLVPLVVVAVFVRVLARARARARGIPFSRVYGGTHIGADFPERREIAADEVPPGEMDDMAAYDREATATRDEFDADAVNTRVRDFYERTGAYAMTYRTWWHRGFRLGASLAAPLTSRIEQLNLPGPGDVSHHRLRSRFAQLRSDVDPREEARAWVRTDAETGDTVFVALYASHVAESDVKDAESSEDSGERLVNIAAPLPWTNLSTVLRIRHFPDDTDSTGVELTTWAGEDPGLYLVTPLGALKLPMEQRFRVWPPEATDAPEAIDPRASLVATHEMWLLGRQFLTIEYAMWEDT